MEPSDQLKALRQQPYAVQGRGGDRRRMENSVRLPLGKAILCAPAEEMEKAAEIRRLHIERGYNGGEKRRNHPQMVFDVAFKGGWRNFRTVFSERSLYRKLGTGISRKRKDQALVSGIE